MTQDRAHDGAGSRGSSASSTGSSVFAHQHPQQGYPTNLPPHHFQLQSFDPTNGSGFPYPSSHHSLLQNQTQHHHLLPPLPSFSHSNFAASPSLPHDSTAGQHFPPYFSQNRNHHLNTILDQHHQPPLPQQPHHSHVPHPQPSHHHHHNHQFYVPSPDPFLPYHNDHHSNQTGLPAPGRAFNLPFPQNSHQQHQLDSISRLQAPKYPPVNHSYQNSNSNPAQNQNGGDGRVDLNSRPASASTYSQPPRPGTATSSSTKGKRRASDAGLDEEDVKPDLEPQQQQQQPQDQQQVFQVRGGGIVTVSQNDPENGVRIWEQENGTSNGGFVSRRKK